MLEKAIAGRLGRAADFPIAHVAPATEKLMARLTSELTEDPPSFLRGSTKTPVAVWTFIALNLLMFGAELAMGGATNVRTLHRLGAPEPNAVLSGQHYWRLPPAPFLHSSVPPISFILSALSLPAPGV
mgnify:CR=1 FL=1